MINHIAQGRIFNSKEEHQMSDLPGTFMIKGQIFPYLNSYYNNATYNERSVEVPTALYLYNKVKAKIKNPATDGKILEVGAVLPHYHPRWVTGDEGQRVFPHLCIDQYELGPGIINKDIRLWEPRPTDKFDLILSISTLEHIFDRDRTNYPDEKKIGIFRELMDNIRSWLAPHGLIMITIPAGQPQDIGGGSWVDTYINLLRENLKGKGRDEIWHKSDPEYLVKMNRMGHGVGGNKWHEVDILKADLPYYESVPTAGTVYFLFYGDIYKLWYS